jgi:hypothetical protein
MILYEQIQEEMNVDLLSFGNMEILGKIFGLEYAQNWARRRANLGIEVKAIMENNKFNDNIRSMDSKVKRITKLQEFKYISKSVFSIYAHDKMMIYEPTKNQIITINNEDIVNLFRNIFDMAWGKIGK